MAKQESALRAASAGRVGEHAERSYTRFALPQRVEHIVLLVSFSLLGLTGLVQKYAGSPVAEWLIKALGGIELIRTIHHASAIVFVLLAIYHFVVLCYKVFVLHSELSMLPGVKDLTDVIALMRYNLGLSKVRPSMPRYSFDEKVEYWAMIWGTIVMAITGFMLWNPILVTKFFPGQLIPAAKAAHGAEAVLAVLAILVWHFYNVHIKTFNKSMFTGKMSEHHMAEEHGEELAMIKAGQVRTRPPQAIIRQRARFVMPAAIAAALLMTAGVYWLATAEKTAITTVPTPPVKVFVPLPPTLAPTVAAAQIGKPIPHDTAGKEQCDTCHGPKGIKPYPADHAGRPNVSCLVCHQTGGQATGTGAASGAVAAAATIPHPVEGRADCLMCHKAGGLNPVPASHEGRTNDTCQMCHKLNVGITGTPEAATTSTGGTTSGPQPVPHDLAGKEKCDTCHGLNGLKPFPKDHDGRANDSCTMCHKPASAASGSSAASPTPVAGATSAAGVAKAIPHALAGQTQCEVCHGLSGLKPYPKDHVGRANDTCIMCHKAAGAATPEASATPAASGTATEAPKSTTGAAKAIPHDLTGKAQCDLCHGTNGLKPYPADHAGRSNDTCMACHKAAEAATPQASATVSEVANATPSGNASTTETPQATTGGPKAIPHDLTGKAQCDLCHGTSGLKPYPADHAGRSNDNCTMCHKPASAATPEATATPAS